jgi:hypothetical protein
VPTFSPKLTSQANPREYWAAEPDVKTFAANLGRKIDAYYDYLYATGRVDVWRRCVRTLYGYDAEGGYRRSHFVTFGGEQGELVQLRANIFRSFVRALHVTITGSPPTYTCQSTSDDAQSLQQVETGNAVLDYYFDTQTEREGYQMAWYALTFGEGWLYTRWDFHKGKPVGVELQQDPTGIPIGRPKVVWNGDVAITALKPEDVIRDVGRMNDNHDWLVACTTVNRYDLAARYPEYEDKIIEATPRARWRDIRTRMGQAFDMYADDSDCIPVYEFWHKPTDALPQGRYAMLIGDTLVFDEPMAYSKLPLHSMIPNIEIDSCQGYGETWDLLSIQQAIDSLVTQLVSNRENFGMRNVFVKTNSNLVPTMLSTGFRLLEGMEKPEVLDFGEGYAQEGVTFYEFLKGIAQLETGLNDTVLGDAGKQQSGDALEMLHSMAVQYNSGGQQAYSNGMRNTMSGILECVRLYCKDKRLVSIVGKNKRSIAREFSSADVSSLRGVTIEIGAAIMRTSMGRKQVADKLYENQSINGEQYLEMQATGRLEAAYEKPNAVRINIDSENEKLADGIPCMVYDTDNHAIHISEHSALIDDPANRGNPQVLQVVIQHIAAHNQTWLRLSTTPDGMAILAATNQQPHPGAQMYMQQQAAMMGNPAAADPMMQAGAGAQPNPDAMGGNVPPEGMPDQPPTDASAGIDGGDLPEMMPADTAQL